MLDLFSDDHRGGRRGNRDSRASHRSLTPAGGSSRTRGERRTTPRTAGVAIRIGSEEERALFTNCVTQVQRHLKSHASAPNTLHILASYYTKVEPRIEGRPFCVSLSHATFLFHMMMARISLSDVDLYVMLIANVLSQIPDDDQLHHPFVQVVLRDHVFGLPSPTSRGGAHCVVLVPPPQYRAFSTLTSSLVSLGHMPLSIVYQWQEKLEHYCTVTSPIVANRALALLVQTVDQVRTDEQVKALQYVLRTKPAKMNLDFLLACYERLKRAVTNPHHGPTAGRALTIHCSEIFLRFRSPIRREYVERFLYPSLCHPDMLPFLTIPSTRQHLMRELLSQCVPGLNGGNPFYLCICALLQPSFDDEIDGALETVTLINCCMPHAAYFMSSLAIDSRMSVSMFAKVVIALARGAGLAMTGREVEDEVATRLNKNCTSVYNVIFVLREVVRSCSVTASRRATDMLKALRVAIPMTSIEALGKLSIEAFDGNCDITVNPQLLCAELGMVLFQEHIDDAMDSARRYFQDVTELCHFCGMLRSASLLCPVNGTVHVSGQSSVSRVLSTLAECAGTKAVESRLIQYLRDPSMQMERAVHFLVYHILENAGQHRSALFVAIEPYIRSTLMALMSADRTTTRAVVSSEHKANVLMLHVKLAVLLSTSVDPSYVASILKVFSELKLRNNHDALALWFMCNVLLRNVKGNLDLLPTDPQENNYCVAYPGCAPTSATSADNAQLVLKLLGRAHSFSPEMRKMVGCCVCKLIQDFNMQAPNIISTLLSPFGFVPIGLPSLYEFALPVGAGSTFWSFFLHQMKTSAPARTALMTALAKSMSRRFRIATPSDAITPRGSLETTGHLFAVMMYEAMKRSPALARVVLFMMSNWMKQGAHPPGKFVCLVYICVQLVCAIAGRGTGDAAVEMEAETNEDRNQFDESMLRTTKLLRHELPRLNKLIPAVQQENPEFCALVQRLQRKVRRTVSFVDGTSEPEEVGESDYSVSDVRYGEPSEPPAQPLHDAAFSMEELQDAADNIVFDSLDATGHGDYVEPTTLANAHVPTFGQHSTGLPGSGTSLSLVSSDRDMAVGQHGRQPSTINPASFAKMIRQLHPQGQRPAQHPRELVGGEMKSSVVDAGATSGSPWGANESYGEMVDKSDCRLNRNKTSSCSHSCGVQTNNGDGVRSTSPATSPSEHQRYEPPVDAAATRGVGVSAPARQSVGTSPIHLQDALATPTAYRAKNRNRSHTLPMSLMHGEVGHIEDGNGREQLSPTSGEASFAWHEPSFMEYLMQGDTTPIDVTSLPQLQATTAVVLPSAMLLEYLRTQQGTDSLRHELLQLKTNQLIDYAGAHSATQASPHGTDPTVHPVTMEGRPNNYSVPHTSGDLAPHRTVLAHVQMTSASGASDPHPHLAARSGITESEEVVDGEHPITSVSEDVDARGKRRRIDARPPADGERGISFFLHQNQTHNMCSTLDDIHGMQQQKDGMDILARQAREGQPGNVPIDDDRCGVEGRQPTGAGPRTPHHYQNPVAEGMQPTTPYGQVIIPACFVEQKNDTAIREVRQVMGAYDPNDTRLSTAGKRRMRGSGTGSATVTESANRSSSVWWAEMSSAPMPGYATDPQYSMELF